MGLLVKSVRELLLLFTLVVIHPCCKYSAVLYKKAKKITRASVGGHLSWRTACYHSGSVLWVRRGGVKGPLVEKGYSLHGLCQGFTGM